MSAGPAASHDGLLYGSLRQDVHCPPRLMREKLRWMSLVYICVFCCLYMIAEMDQIASQHEPIVIFLGLWYMSLLACLAGAVCAISGALAGCLCDRVARLLLISFST